MKIPNQDKEATMKRARRFGLAAAGVLLPTGIKESVNPGWRWWHSMLLGLAAMLVVLVAPAGVVQAAPLPPDDQTFVDNAVADVMSEYGLPGLMIKITGPAGSYTKTYGVSNIKTNRPLKLRDGVRIASITKSFTATAVLLLVQDGTLRLDDKLAEYVEDIPFGEQITIRELLAMRSGVYEFSDDPDFLTTFNADPLYPGWKPEKILPILRSHEPQFPPGTRTVYTDSNYILLGLIIEKATGRSARRVITDSVIKPLGLMRHTYFPAGPGLRAPYAHGYYAGDDNMGPVVDYTKSNPNVPWTGGGMVSTLTDLQTWGKALAKGTLLSKRLQRERLEATAFSNVTANFFFGYGLGIIKIGDWFGHDGAILGYSTVTFYEPDSGAQIVAAANRSSNSSTPTLDVFGRIAMHLYPDSF
jgi:D-alanyl-D-alanine carboxypeptidase